MSNHTPKHPTHAQRAVFRLRRGHIVTPTFPCLLFVPILICPTATPPPTSPSRPQIEIINLLDEPKENPAQP